MNTSKSTVGTKAVVDGLGSLEREVQRIGGSLEDQFNRINARADDSSMKMGIWSRAFRGAFIGAVTGAVFSTVVGGIESIITKTEDAITSSIEYAAKLEMTTNAMSFFTGSVTAGKDEIAKLDAISRNTPGLRMQDAEQGVARLKALGFQLQTAENLVVGLSKQKIISGVDDEGAMNRTILHLQQLEAGSGNVTRSIRQMLLAFPSLGVEMEKAFGSVDKFTQAIKNDPDAALTKLAASMATTQIPTTGLTNAVEKLEDAGISLARAFGEPMLAPLTNDAMDLQKWLLASIDTAHAWGSELGDAIRGVSDAWHLAAEAKHYYESGGGGGTAQSGVSAAEVIGGGVVGGLANAFSGGLYGAYKVAGLYGQMHSRNQSASQATGDFFQNLFSYSSLNPAGNLFTSPQDTAPSFGGGTGSFHVDTDRLRQISDQQTEQKITELKRQQSSELAVLKDSYAIQEKALDVHHRYTLDQEMQYSQQLYNVKASAEDHEWALQSKQYGDLYKLAGDDAKEKDRIQSEWNKAYASHVKNEYDITFDMEKKKNDLYAQEAEVRRQAALESSQLEEQALSANFNAQTFNIQRQIDQTSTGYEKMGDLARSHLLDETKTISDQLAIQLQDRKLTAEKRVNLETAAHKSIVDAEEAYREKLLQIQDQKDAIAIARIATYAQRVQSLMGVNIQAGQSIMGTLTPGAFFGAALPDLRLLSTVDARSASQLGSQLPLLDQGIGSMYGIRASQQDLAHKRQLEMAQAEWQSHVDTAEYLRQNEPGNKQLESEMSTIRLLTLKKDQLLTDQAIEKQNLKLAEDLQTINAWTKKIADGTRDSYILEDQRVKQAQQYQNVVLEARTQTLVLNDKDLVTEMRKTELIKDQIALRNDELNALFRIDKANLQIAQQGVYSKNQADAKVAEFLGQQKGITDVVADAKINLMTTAYNGLDAVLGRVTSKMGAFGDALKSVMMDLIKLALNRVFQRLFLGDSAGSGAMTMPNLGSGTGHGTGTGGIFGGLFGGGGNMGPGGTPYFNPTGTGGSIFGTDASHDPLGVGHDMGGHGASGAAGTMSNSGIWSQITGPGGIFGSKGFGNNLGTYSAVGAGGALLGGLIGGKAGTVISMTGMGLSMGAFIGSLFGPGPGTAIGAAIGAGAGFLAGVIASIFGGNKQRRADETTRNSAMVDALSQLDKLISDVKNDKTDGASAMAQADTIRSNYLQAMSQLKDSKTRNIALKDVSRLDAKIADLKQASADQISRQDRLQLMVPTFAAGGAIDPGYQTGFGTGRSDNMLGFFPSAGQYAAYSPTEYILDAETTKNVGVYNLDLMRSTKGSSFHEMRKQGTPRRAMGGAIAQSMSMGDMFGSSDSSQGSSGPITLELNLQVGIAETDFVKVISSYVKDNNGSKEQIQTIVNALSNMGPGNPLAALLARQVNNQ